MVIKRVGGKAKIASWIISKFPPYERFVDVFGGSGAVIDAFPLLDKSNNGENIRYIYNDLDKKLFNFFRMLREKPLALADEISLIPYSRDEFEESLSLFQNPEQYDSLSDLDKAVVFLIVNRQSFGAKMTRPWSITLDGEINYSTWSKLPSVILKTAKRFKHVYLENLDYRELINKWDSPETLFYCDPPYEGVEDDYYEVNRTDGFSHQSMLDLLLSVKGNFAVSYYGGETPDQDSRLIREYASHGFRIYRKQVMKHLAATDQKSSATEVLIVKGSRPHLVKQEFE